MSDSKTAFLITPLVRFCHLHIWQSRMPPTSKPGDKARYSAVGLIQALEAMDVGDQEKMKALLQAVQNCAVNAFTAEKVKLLQGEDKFGTPFRKDVKSKGYPDGFKWFIQPWNHNPFGIVSVYKGPDGKPLEIKDPTKIWSGCWGRMVVHPFAYDTNGNKGVSFGLDGIQVVKANADDPLCARLDNRVDARNVFEASEDAPAGLDLSSGGGGSGPAAHTQGDANELAALLGGS